MNPAREAAAAAFDAGVDIRPAASEELVGFLESIWGVGRTGDPSLLQAITHAGNSALLARRGDAVVGAALGVLGWGAGLHVHSHMVAVDPGIRASGIGFAIKLAQRAQALENGVTEMRWTFDPLIRRNAHFTLVKIGAEVIAYRPNFYGTLDDAINGTDATDRFEVSWRLDAPVGSPPADGPDDLELPVDYEALRREQPAEAATLRIASARFFARSLPRFTGTGYVS